MGLIPGKPYTLDLVKDFVLRGTVAKDVKVGPGEVEGSGRSRARKPEERINPDNWTANDRVTWSGELPLSPPCDADRLPGPDVLTQEIAADLQAAMDRFRASANEFKNRLPDVSPIALGCMTYGDPDRGHPTWSLTEEQSRPLIKQAVEAGINFFDTANMYSQGSSEEIVGRA